MQLSATPDEYAIPLKGSVAELLATAPRLHLDGSDLVPGEVGAGSFW